jgi:hypothetical protein
MKYLISILTMLCLVAMVQPAIAQEEDPFADYSYLWEDKKKKKKKKKNKKNKRDEAAAEAVQPPTPSESLFASDTLPLPADAVPNVDTADTLPPQTSPVDSMITQPEEPTPEPEDEEIAEEKPRKEKQKKERKELPPVQDFRAGLPSAGSGGSFTGGFTLTEIDGQYFAGLVLSPEFSLGKVGLGLNIPVLYGFDDRSIRTEIFEDGVGVARLIRYLRLGNQKQDPIYFRIGELSSAMIGYGGLINNYTNTTSFEKRKLGIHYDLNFRGLVSIEGLYSDFNPA